MTFSIAVQPVSGLKYPNTVNNWESGSDSTFRFIQLNRAMNNVHLHINWSVKIRQKIDFLFIRKIWENLVSVR